MSIYNLSRGAVEAKGYGGIKTTECDNEGYSHAHVLNEFDLCVWDQDRSITPHMKEEGFWEAWITSWFTQWVRPGMHVIDIGAHCGYFTMLNERLVGPYGRVTAYEPNPVYVKALKHTKKVNNANFAIAPFAVGNDLNAGVELFVPRNLTGGASLRGSTTLDEYDVVKVQQTTLPHEIRKGFTTYPDIIKIDVEGNEEYIWDGMEEILENRWRHLTLVLEYTPRHYSDEFYDKLNDWGVVTVIGFGGLEHPASKDYLDSLDDWQMIVVRKR